VYVRISKADKGALMKQKRRTKQEQNDAEPKEMKLHNSSSAKLPQFVQSRIKNVRIHIPLPDLVVSCKLFLLCNLQAVLLHKLLNNKQWCIGSRVLYLTCLN
jgi:hypothetical protein